MATSWFLVLLIVVHGKSQEQTPRPQQLGDPVLYPQDYCSQLKDKEEFDFIVVGAGPAGSAVARRLAEIPSNNVLLLEAGGDPPVVSDIADDGGKVGPENIWNFQSTKDPNECRGFIGGVCKYFAGKVLGGSSVINQMLYVRGNPEDFEEWQRMGNKGWGYQDVLPYFKKMENYLAHPIVDKTEALCHNQPNYNRFLNPPVSSEYHSTGGPLTISAFQIDPRTYPIRQALIKSFQANGIPYNNDVNSDNQIGITNIPGMVDQLGYRNNIAKAYLLNIPKNLKICKHALVHKLNLDASETPIKVTSVKFVHNPSSSKKRTLTVSAKKEYILSGGVLNSPGILERSGIGIPKILNAAKVKPILNLNVGEKYQDQFANSGSAFSVDYGTELATNPLTYGLASLATFINVTDFKSSVPDIQYYLFSYEPKIGIGLAFKPEIAAQFNAAVAEKGLMLFGDAILRQTKFGSVHIKQSANPLLTPEIIVNQLSTRRDIDLTVTSTRLARKIMSNEAMGPFKVEPFLLKECKKFPFGSEEEIMCGARMLTSTLYHQAGTCSMGPEDDKNSVVDPQLRVIGTSNLRVVDTSIMPLVTRGNTEIPAVMIGEKGADLIKQSWGQINV